MLQFFYVPPIRSLELPSDVTEILSTESDRDGNVKLVKKDIQTFLGNLALLSYSDFTLAEMIKNGVSYDSLNITDDMRMGHESDFAAFEERFKSLESQIFTETPPSES